MLMPKITACEVHAVEDMEIREYEIAISHKGRLRATKPTCDGFVQYVWRMVAFLVSPNPRHHCMPCTAEFGIDIRDSEGRWDVTAVHAECKRLDVIVDAIVDTIPPSEWHGVHRWGQAFGQIGTPKYNDEGAVIYR